MAVDFTLQVILRGLDQITAPLRNATAQLGKMAAATEKLKRVGEGMSSVGARAAATGLAMGAAVKTTVGAYVELEQAQVQAVNAFSTSSGISQWWKDINAQAIQAGNIYPGTSADFITLAASMKMAGADAEQMAKGGFKAASALQVMFRHQGLGPEEAGRIFQTMQNAMGIAGKDAMFFADQLQRVSYASGLTISGVSEGLKYAASGMKQLGVQGKEAAPLVLAVMGALRKGGLDDSQVGTAMKQFMDRIATAQARIAGGDTRGAAMRFAFQGLEQAGIDFQFFDENKKFLGMANAIGQLSQLKNAPDQVRIAAAKALFGEQGGRMATGDFLERVNEMIGLMRQQEDMQKRLDRITGTLGNSMEALGGSFRNIMAAIGEKMAPQIQKLATSLNGVLDRVGKWIDKNPELVGQLGMAAGGLAGLLTVGGGFTWVLGGMITTMAKAVPLLGMVGKAALAAWPWTVGIGVAVWLLAKHWDTVGGNVKQAGVQFGYLMEEIGGLTANLKELFTLDFGPMLGNFDLLEGVAYSVSKLLQFIVYGVRTVVVLGSMLVNTVLGPVIDSVRTLGTYADVYGRERDKGTNPLTAAWRANSAASKVAATLMDKRLTQNGQMFDSLGRGVPSFDYASFSGAKTPSAAPQLTQSVTVNVQGGDPEKVKQAVADAMDERAEKFMRLLAAKRAVSERGNFSPQGAY